MSTSIFKVKPSEIRQAASDLKQKLADLDASIRKLDSISTQVQSSWQDAASNTYLTKFTEKEENISKIVNNLSDLPRLLEKYANEIEAKQQEISQKAGGEL